MPVRLQAIDYPRDEILDIGTFDYVQLTYETLRVGPKDDEIAYFDCEKEKWIYDGKDYSDISIG